MNTEDIAIFHRIVETESIAKASTKLNIPKSTVSRRIKSLEDKLGIKLFHRYGREMRLTQSGHLFYEKTIGILTDLDKTVFELTNKKAELKGTIRVLIFPGPDIYNVYANILAFKKRTPSLCIELITTNYVTDLIKESIDVAIMPESTFSHVDVVAKLMHEESLRFFASPKYISEHGKPSKFKELVSHNFTLLDFGQEKKYSQIELPDHTVQSVKSDLITNDLNIVKHSVLEGNAIGLLPVRMCTPHIRSGEMVELFSSYPEIMKKIYMVFPSRKHISLSAQRFIDEMCNMPVRK